MVLQGKELRKFKKVAKSVDDVYTDLTNWADLWRIVAHDAEDWGEENVKRVHDLQRRILDFRELLFANNITGDEALRHDYPLTWLHEASVLFRVTDRDFWDIVVSSERIGEGDSALFMYACIASFVEAYYMQIMNFYKRERLFTGEVSRFLTEDTIKQFAHYKQVLDYYVKLDFPVPRLVSDMNMRIVKKAAYKSVLTYAWNRIGLVSGWVEFRGLRLWHECSGEQVARAMLAMKTHGAALSTKLFYATFNHLSNDDIEKILEDEVKFLQMFNEE